MWYSVTLILKFNCDYCAKRPILDIEKVSVNCMSVHLTSGMLTIYNYVCFDSQNINK